MMTSLLRKGSIGLVAVVGAACATNDTADPLPGNVELGIAGFEVEETATKTTVIGRDADQREVARLELIYGRFALSDYFKDDYPGQPEVDGRKLDVAIGGEPRFVWETAGYDPVLHMPAHAPSAREVAAFLDDPHVKPVLDRWQIGFEPFGSEPAGEAPYGAGTVTGASPTFCSTLGPANYQCGTARDSLTVNECGGTSQAIDATRVTRTTGGGFTYNEYMVAQCCPSGSGGQSSDWWAQKSCPTTGTAGEAVASTCGTAAANAACKGCGVNLHYWGFCALTSVANGVDYAFQTESQNHSCYFWWDYEPCEGPLPSNNECSLSCECEGLDVFICAWI